MDRGEGGERGRDKSYKVGRLVLKSLSQGTSGLETKSPPSSLSYLVKRGYNRLKFSLQSLFGTGPIFSSARMPCCSFGSSVAMYAGCYYTLVFGVVALDHPSQCMAVVIILWTLEYVVSMK